MALTVIDPKRGCGSWWWRFSHLVTLLRRLLWNTFGRRRYIPHTVFVWSEVILILSIIAILEVNKIFNIIRSERRTEMKLPLSSSPRSVVVLQLFDVPPESPVQIIIIRKSIIPRINWQVTVITDTLSCLLFMFDTHTHEGRTLSLRSKSILRVSLGMDMQCLEGVIPVTLLVWSVQWYYILS